MYTEMWKIRRFMLSRRWSPAFLTLFITTAMVFIILRPQSGDSRVDSGMFVRQRLPRCRPDMEVNTLPTMPDADDVLLATLFTYLKQPHPKTCKKVAVFGGGPVFRVKDHLLALDGYKYVCMDFEFGLPFADPCLVYSIGISSDWSFDWDMEGFGCDVYSFDPSIKRESGYQNGTIVFLHYGIGDQDEVRSDNGWKMRTLDTFVRKLGHSDSFIHYLKVDVEGAEWPMFQQQTRRMRNSALFKNVEQIGVELHFDDYLPFRDHMEFYRDVYDMFLRLQEMGFFLFSFETNGTQNHTVSVPGLTENLTSAIEVVWLKTTCPYKANEIQVQS